MNSLNFRNQAKKPIYLRLKKLETATTCMHTQSIAKHTILACMNLETACTHEQPKNLEPPSLKKSIYHSLGKLETMHHGRSQKIELEFGCNRDY